MGGCEDKACCCGQDGGDEDEELALHGYTLTRRVDEALNVGLVWGWGG